MLDRFVIKYDERVDNVILEYYIPPGRLPVEIPVQERLRIPDPLLPLAVCSFVTDVRFFWCALAFTNSSGYIASGGQRSRLDQRAGVKKQEVTYV